MKNSRSNLFFLTIRYSTTYLILSLLTIVFLVKLVQSFGWRLHFDTAVMHYIAYLINEHGFAPYRDIFDINMPGSYLVHMAVGKLLGSVQGQKFEGLLELSLSQIEIREGTPEKVTANTKQTLSSAAMCF